MNVNSGNPLVDFQGYVKLTNAHPSIVVAVQNQLIKVGLYTGDANGLVSPSTLKAFAKFKELEYLEQPELLGITTAHALLNATEEHSVPQDNEKVKARLQTIRIPEIGLVTPEQRIYPGSHFTWGEFTKNLTRIPENHAVTRNLIKLAHYLDNVREILGNRAITVTSCYRPLSINRACNGAVHSRHIFGDAADIVVQGIPPHEVYKNLDPWHGDKGGLGNSSQFTHVDQRGYKARWVYGNA